MVIDNGSTDDTTTFIHQHYPEVTLIASEKNTGFGQANNKGIEIAINNNADYVFLLNQDAWIEHDAIVKLVAAHQANNHYGILSPVHLNGAGTAVDRYFLKYFIESEADAFIGSKILNAHNEVNLIDTQFVNAAAWLISKSCIVRTGGFDPIFFHYGEDLNYTHRVLYRGFKIGIVTDAVIYHDREDRIAKSSTPDNNMKKDWIYFLAQACDIRNPRYKKILWRRFFRCLLTGLWNVVIFNFPNAKYNFYFVGNIIFYSSAIAHSRSNAMEENRMPYLQTAK